MRLVGVSKDLSEGYITAEFNFDIIDVFKQHFRIHNVVVVSFRPDMMLHIQCQTMILRVCILP